MDKNELRIKIYEFLGLEVGSLVSESGNDWQRAEKEVLEDYKYKELEKLQKIKIVDYLILDKHTDEFTTILKSTFVGIQHLKNQIASRDDLDIEEINQLINTGDKDVLINLVKNKILNTEQIDLIIPRSVYLVKKYLITKQFLTSDQKNKLILFMKQSNLNYDTLIKSLE